MNSDYLNQNRSIKELDDLFEKDRVAAEKFAVTVFSHEISTAITNINAINQVAGARILADSHVASAKMMTDAEVSAAHLLSKAEIAIMEMQGGANKASTLQETHGSMVSEIRYVAEKAITHGARQSIADIKRETQESIAQLKAHADKATQEIKSIADDVRAKISANATTAKEKLDVGKKQPRTPEGVNQDAEAAEEKILSAAKTVTDELHLTIEVAIAGLNAIVEEVGKSIIDAAAKSEARIMETRDKALEKISELSEKLFPRSSI